MELQNFTETLFTDKYAKIFWFYLGVIESDFNFALLWLTYISNI